MSLYTANNKMDPLELASIKRVAGQTAVKEHVRQLTPKQLAALAEFKEDLERHGCMFHVEQVNTVIVAQGPDLDGLSGAEDDVLAMIDALEVLPTRGKIRIADHPEQKGYYVVRWCTSEPFPYHNTLEALVKCGKGELRFYYEPWSLKKRSKIADEAETE